ncbi:hypothetical protein PS623_03946 [Pseudomonas fluorescens]|nr:hypothetical protein PS623_03946 [Pseudomonas fluorescens]
MGLAGLVEKARVGDQAALFHRTVQIEQRLADLVHLPEVGQVRAVAQIGQFVEQGFQLLTLLRLLLPARQQRLGIEQNVHALGQKAGDQLRVTPTTAIGRGFIVQCR